MNDLYIECINGLDENSLLSALYEASGAGEEFLEKLNTMGFDNINVSAVRNKNQGIMMTRFEVTVKEEELPAIEDLFPEDGLYAFEAGYAEYVKQVELQNAMSQQARRYGARNLKPDGFDAPAEEEVKIEAAANYDTPGQVFQIINSLDVSDEVKEKVKEIYDSVASARADLGDVHYSKVKYEEEGELKSIIYTVAIALLIEMIGPDRIVSSYVNRGSGSVMENDDIHLVPKPVTAHMLKDIPTVSDSTDENMISTMAAAVLKHYCDSFSMENSMVFDRIGYGLYENEKGTRYSRVFLGSID